MFQSAQDRPHSTNATPGEGNMNALELDHPNDSLLTAFGLGQLGEDELVAINEHLAVCADCRQAVEKVAHDTFLTLLHSAATEPDSKQWTAAAADDVPASEAGST